MTEVQLGEENDEGTTNDAGTVTQEEPKAAKSKKFHDLISRNTIKSFKSTLVTQVIKRGDKTSTVSVNHDIIESLLSFSTKHEKLIGSCSADGIRRKVNKSKLLELILPKQRLTWKTRKSYAFKKLSPH